MIDAVGYAAGLCAMVAFLPQLVKSIRTKRTADISVAMLVMNLIINILYITYGLMLGLLPVVVMLGIMTSTIVLQIVLTLRFQSEAQV